MSDAPSFLAHCLSRLCLCVLCCCSAKLSYNGYDHIHFWVANAKQAAAFYVLRFGFEYAACQSHSLTASQSYFRCLASHLRRHTDASAYVCACVRVS